MQLLVWWSDRPPTWFTFPFEMGSDKHRVQRWKSLVHLVRCFGFGIWVNKVRIRSLSKNIQFIEQGWTWNFLQFLNESIISKDICKFECEFEAGVKDKNQRCACETVIGRQINIQLQLVCKQAPNNGANESKRDMTCFSHFCDFFSSEVSNSVQYSKEWLLKKTFTSVVTQWWTFKEAQRSAQRNRSH